MMEFGWVLERRQFGKYFVDEFEQLGVLEGSRCEIGGVFKFEVSEKVGGIAGEGDGGTQPHFVVVQLACRPHLVLQNYLYPRLPMVAVE
jgi:hypothetical protein